MLPRATALADSAAPVTDVVELRFDQRERSRLRARLASGEEIGIDLPVGTVLHHGSRLELDGGRVVAVEAAIESLLEITADDGAGLARIAYHVGNRHVPIEIAGDRLRILPDHVLRAMVEGLGDASARWPSDSTPRPAPMATATSMATTVMTTKDTAGGFTRSTPRRCAGRDRP